MTENADDWKRLREFVRYIAIARIHLVILTAVVFPLAESVMAGFFTSAPHPMNWWAGGILSVLIVIHILTFLCLLWADLRAPATNALDAIINAQSLEHTRRELVRRSESSALIRKAFDALNFQACNISAVGEGPPPFKEGLKPILSQLSCGLTRALGVSSVEFTIESYFDAYAIEWNSSAIHNEEIQTFENDSVFPVFLVDPQGVGEQRPFRLGCRSAFAWGWTRPIVGQGTIDDDKERFLSTESPEQRCYFYRFAVVPIKYSCSEERAGLLVLTSTQREGFAEDVLDVMQFLASLLSQYIACYNRCSVEWQQQVQRERRNENRRKNKQAKATASRESASVDEILVEEVDDTKCALSTPVWPPAVLSAEWKPEKPDEPGGTWELV